MKNLDFSTMPIPPGSVFALVQQVIILCFSALLLDGGFVAMVCMAAGLAFWVSAIIYFALRHAVWTYLDTIVIRWAYIPICIGIFILAAWMMG